MFEKAIQLRPNFAKPHKSLGRVLRQKGKLDEAIQHFEKAIRLDPSYGEAYADLGAALMSKDDMEGAIKALQKAVALGAGYSAVRYNLITALRKIGDNAAAEREYQEYLRAKEAEERRSARPPVIPSSVIPSLVVGHWSSGISHQSSATTQ